tara:strand:- start:2738 stop:4279 length:1542 start_codon:yes stop_codon:yes gene_type:complete
MSENIDIVFITPNNSSGIYQELSNEYSAIETPTWSLLLAESCRSIGFKVSIIDTLAENISDDKTENRIKQLNPRLICFVIYGQNVNSGTTNMSGAIRLSNFLKKKNIHIPIIFVGSHVQALPSQTLKEENSIDIVCVNEGVYSIRNLLKLKNYNFENLKKINGIYFRYKNEIIKNPPEIVVPNDRMDIDLPGYAWDLLPYKNKRFDLYRSPLWHAEYKTEFRTPYAAIQTSLGCQFACSFCMINIINRDDNDEIGVSGNYSKMRYWSPEFIIKEFDKLFSYGVKTIKITDEMFLLNPKYYKPLCELLKKRNEDDSLKIWAYSRIDTIRRPEILKMVRDAGIKWLALGIESADKNVRLEVSKGKFEDVDVKTVVSKIHDADINVLANYIFGLPSDDMESMKKTLDLSLDLCTLGWNGYAAMALPGSELYKDALSKGYKLPEDYQGYSFHAYDTMPLPTEKLTSKQILSFRDNAFHKYFTNDIFLKKIENKFGTLARDNILKMTEIKLKRKILEN